MPPVNLKGHDLAGGMHAGIGAAGTDDSATGATDLAERRFQFALNRSTAVIGLALKSDEICPVVGNLCTNLQTHSMIAIGALSPFRGPSLVMRV